MSIFQKDCPQCAASNAARASRCKCGYFFDTTAAGGKQATAAVALQEETLYEDYLSARVVQAEATLEVARGNAAADPTNTYKAAEVLVAEQALSAARAELRAQTERTAQLKKVSRRTEPAAGIPAPRPPAVLEIKPAPTVAPHKLIPKREPARSKAPSAPVAKPAEIRSPPKPAAPKQAAKPNAKFRNRQAAKAAAVVRAARIAPPPAPVAPATAPVAVKSLPAPVQKPAAKAAPKKVTAAATKDCPHCTATVAAAVERCRCGFGFTNASFEMPSLSLDAGSSAIASDDIKFGITPRRG